MTAKWSTKSIEQIEKMLGTNAASGLSRKAARVRQKKGGDNIVYAPSSSALGNYVFHLFGDLTSYLLIISAIVAAVFDYSALAAVIFICWTANVILTFLTYIKAEKTFECAANYSMPKTRVIRDGRLFVTDMRNVVRGDVILLRAGDIAPCDLRLVSSKDLGVLEFDEDKKRKPRRKDAAARMTDDEVRPAGEQNMVFALSIIASGEARAIAVDTSEDTYTHSLIGEPELSREKKLSVFEKLGKYCTWWSIAMLALILPVSLIGMKNGFFDSFMLGLALASSTMSGMLTAIGRIIIACSITNAALVGDENKNTAIIKNISKTEKMPAVDALLVLDDGVFLAGETTVDGFLADDEKTLFESALIASGISLEKSGIAFGTDKKSADDTALIERAEKIGVSEKDLARHGESAGFVPASEYNFDTSLLKKENGFSAYVKGDAFSMIPRCTRYLASGKDLPMTDEQRRRIAAFADEMYKKYRRCFVVARRESPYNNLRRISSVQSDFTYIGVIALGDPVISCAKDALVSLRERGTELVYAGATNNRELRELLSDRTLVGAAYFTDDIMRKRKVFSELKARGKTVAVIASDVGDMGILSDADVSFTCSPGDFDRNIRATREDLAPIEKDYGTQAAKKEADVIIKRATGKNFGIASVLTALDYSEMIHRNIENMSKYLMCMLISRMLIVLLSVVFGLGIITPAQILFSGLLVDFFAVLVFAFEKPDRARDHKSSGDALDGTVKKNLFWMILGAVFAIISVSAAFCAKKLIPGFAAEDARTFTFISLVLSQLVFLFECTSDTFILKRKIKMNVIGLAALLFTLGSAVLFVLFGGLGKYMDVQPSNHICIPMALALPFLIFCISEIRKTVKNKKGV